MATIWWEQPVELPADRAWAALRDVGRAHDLFAPVLIAGEIDGDIRTVTFADGTVVRERIVAIDEEHCRIAYTVLGDSFEHHSASMQIVAVDAERCRFVWISDVLPNDRAASIRPLIEHGSAALAANLERGP